MAKGFLMAALLAATAATPAWAQEREGDRVPSEVTIPERSVGGDDAPRWRTRDTGPAQAATPATPPARSEGWTRRDGGQPRAGWWGRNNDAGTPMPSREEWAARRAAANAGTTEQPQPGQDWRREGDGRDRRDWRVGRDDRDGREGRVGRDDRDGRAGRDWRRDGTDDTRGWREGRRDDDWRDGRRGDWRGTNPGVVQPGTTYRQPYAQGWSNQWRQDRRYDWQRHRQNYRHLYRAPRYVAPYGYGQSYGYGQPYGYGGGYDDYGYSRGYSRLTIGVRIGAPYYAERYWLNDPYSYRLPPVGYPYRWVRYYEDVLLVDTRSGYVVDVIHNFFW